MKKRLFVLGCLLAVVSACWWWPAQPPQSPFAEHQTPSSRGTIAVKVACAEPVIEKTRREIQALGGRVISYLPPQSLLVEADEAALQRLAQSQSFTQVQEVLPSRKVAKRLVDRLAMGLTTCQVTIVPLALSDVPVLQSLLVAAQGSLLTRAPTEGGRLIRATVSADLIRQLASRGDVQWIEPYEFPRVLNDVAVTAGSMNVAPVWESLGLTGTNQTVVISDSGLDTGVATTVKEDLRGRVILIREANDTSVYSCKDTNGHGTHTAGSIAGNGALSNGRYKGVAPESELYVWAMSGVNGYLYHSGMEHLFDTGRSTYPMYIHSASWGAVDYAYSATSQTIDDYVWNHPDYLPVFAAGNEAQEPNVVGCSVSTEALSKNVIAVGAVQSNKSSSPTGWGGQGVSAIAAFSSRGPAPDGRIKPDVVAPGTDIVSLRSSKASTDSKYVVDDNYRYMSGTSMATPLTAGTVALIRQWLVEERGYTNSVPSAALMKAVLVGGAADCPVPEDAKGWGRVSLKQSLQPANRTVFLKDNITFFQGSSYAYRFTTTETAPLDVALVWIDYPAAPSADKALVNDLNLVVSNHTSGVVWRGNNAPSAQTQKADDLNTTEVVRTDALEPGTWTVYVEGATVPHTSLAGGAAALYVASADVSSKSEIADENIPDDQREAIAIPCYDYDETSGCILYEDVISTYAGRTVTLNLPEDTVSGQATLDERNSYYLDIKGEKHFLGICRLEALSVGPDDNYLHVQYDDKGRMPTTYSFMATKGFAVYFVYLDEDYVNTEYSELPLWWVYRYLMGVDDMSKTGDPDADGFTNESEFKTDTDPVDATSFFAVRMFEPMRIVWQGGHERKQVLESSTDLIEWKGVYTNAPPTETVVTQKFDRATAPTRFYRVRILE